jgi:hypothetical protein
LDICSDYIHSSTTFESIAECKKIGTSPLYSLLLTSAFDKYFNESFCFELLENVSIGLGKWGTVILFKMNLLLFLVTSRCSSLHQSSAERSTTFSINNCIILFNQSHRTSMLLLFLLFLYSNFIFDSGYNFLMNHSNEIIDWKPFFIIILHEIWLWLSLLASGLSLGLLW